MQLLYSTSALVRNVGLNVIIKGKLIMAIQIKGMDQYSGSNVFFCRWKCKGRPVKKRYSAALSLGAAFFRAVLGGARC